MMSFSTSESNFSPRIANAAAAYRSGTSPTCVTLDDCASSSGTPLHMYLSFALSLQISFLILFNACASRQFSSSTSPPTLSPSNHASTNLSNVGVFTMPRPFNPAVFVLDNTTALRSRRTPTSPPTRARIHASHPSHWDDHLFSVVGGGGACRNVFR